MLTGGIDRSKADVGDLVCWQISDKPVLLMQGVVELVRKHDAVVSYFDEGKNLRYSSKNRTELRVILSINDILGKAA